MVNFIHTNWPSLIRRNFVEEFITPIVKATKGKEEISFFSLPEYKEWKENTENWHTYRIKYYKGMFVGMVWLEKTVSVLRGVEISGSGCAR